MSALDETSGLRMGRSSSFAGTLAELAVRNPDELITDLAALAVAKVARIPLITGQPGLAALDPETAVVVLPRHRT